MGFYNILYLLKKISFNFTNILKYLCIFMIIFLVGFSLMLTFSNKVSAESDVVCYPTGQGIVDLPYSIYTSAINYVQQSNYTDYFIVRTDSASADSRYWLILFNGLSTDTFFINQPNVTSTGLYWLQCTRQNVYTRAYNLTTDSVSYVTDSLTFGTGNYRYRIAGIYSGSYNVYYNTGSGSADLNHVLYPKDDVSVFTPPSFVNYDDSNWSGTLVNGEFNYFYINGNSVDSCYIYFYDTTFGVGDTDDVVWGAILNDSSEYVLHDANGGIYWGINKTIPFGGYKNNRDYKLVIQYFDNNNISQSLDYTWTTDFSQSVIDGEWDNGFADINKGIQDINSFLNNKNMDSSLILNGMPSNDVPDPTVDSINNIFNMFRNVFSTSNARDVVIEIPNTNETITIPSNLVISHIPQPILIIVQSFYWFIICRFIVKDISKVVERAKSGEILDAQDGNIKTDLL